LKTNENVTLVISFSGYIVQACNISCNSALAVLDLKNIQASDERIE